MNHHRPETLQDAYTRLTGVLDPWLRLTGLDEEADVLADVNPTAPGEVVDALMSAGISAFTKSQGAVLGKHQAVADRLKSLLVPAGLPQTQLLGVVAAFTSAWRQAQAQARVDVLSLERPLAKVVSQLWADPALPDDDAAAAVNMLLSGVHRQLDGQAMDQVDAYAAAEVVADAVRHDPGIAVSVAGYTAGQFFDAHPFCAPDEASLLLASQGPQVSDLLEVAGFSAPAGATHRVQVIDLSTGAVVRSMDHTVDDTAGMNIDEQRRTGQLRDADVALWFSSPDVCPFDCDYCRD
jgi:hypothetical protein